MNRQDCKDNTHPSLGFLQGAKDIFPLSIAVIPWAVLAGSVAVHAGLSFMQALGMSALVFAGAAQLVSLSMLTAGASVLSIVLTVFFSHQPAFCICIAASKRHQS